MKKTTRSTKFAAGLLVAAASAVSVAYPGQHAAAWANDNQQKQQSHPSNLPNTGPGQVIAVGAVVAVLSATGYSLATRFKLRRG